METITKARKWQDKNEVRFYIETVDDNGKKHHSYTRYVTGNKWNPAKSWGKDNGAQGEPSAEVIAEYRRLTDGGRQSYYADNPLNPLNLPNRATGDDNYQPVEDQNEVARRSAMNRIPEL